MVKGKERGRGYLKIFIVERGRLLWVEKHCLWVLERGLLGLRNTAYHCFV